MDIISEFIIQLFSNKIFLSVFFSMAASTMTKMSIVLATEKSTKLSEAFRSGGMPSTHSASVTGLTLGVLFGEGVGTLFIITLAFAIIVIHDAMGVRYESALHAAFLNKLIKRHKFDRKYFTEHIGHNLPEVIVGILVGIIVPAIIFSF